MIHAKCMFYFMTLSLLTGFRWTIRFRGVLRPGETLQTTGRKCRALVPQLSPQPLIDEEAYAESAAGAVNVID